MAQSGTAENITGTAPVVPLHSLTVPDAAERAGLSERAVRRALQEGRLRGYQLDGRWLVDANDLDRYSGTARHRKPRATAPTEGGTDRHDADALAEVLREVLARAVEAETRATAAETRLLMIEANAQSDRERADLAEAEVAELRAALAARARRRWWWPFGSEVADA